MRLLINTLPLLGQPTGIGTYTRHIAQGARLAGDVDASFFYGYPTRKFRDICASGEQSYLDRMKGRVGKMPTIRGICKRFMNFGNMLYQTLSGREYSCYFEPNFVFLPNIRHRHCVLTIHDFSCFLYPQWHPEERVRHMTKNLPQSQRKADRIITVSNAIRREAIQKFGIPAEKIVVIHNGVDHSLYRPAGEDVKRELRQRYGLPQNFILYVGAMEPRKNLGNLILAHASLPLALREKFPLMLIGANGWSNAEIMALIQKYRRHVHFLGYVPMRDLPAFYSMASLFAYPSWYEGFGIPVLEAMACGCPVLVSDVPALAELCGDSACRIPPGDVELMGRKIRELLEDADLRRKLAQAGLETAASYSWDASVAKHFSLFRELDRQ